MMRWRSAGVPAGRVTARPAGDLTLPSLWVSSEKHIRHQRNRVDCLFFPCQCSARYTKKKKLCYSLFVTNYFSINFKKMSSVKTCDESVTVSMRRVIK